MNPSAENALWVLIALDNGTARDEMIVSHQGIVPKTAKQYVNGGGQMQLEELCGEGYIALCESVDQFQTEVRTFRFGSFAKVSIRRAIVQFTRTREGTVTKPEWETRKERDILRDVEKLRLKIGRNPTHEEVSFEYGDSAASIWDHLHDGLSYVEIDDCIAAIPPKVFDTESFTPPVHIRTLLQELSDGASLSILADEWECPREQLREDAMAYWDDKSTV